MLSGVSGYLNNLDAATYSKFLYQLSRLIHGQEEDAAVRLPRGGELLFDFALPGATHGLRLSNELRFMKHSTEDGLQIVMDRLLPADTCDVYYKPFYRRADFDDERYKPVFSPTVYSGQILRCRIIPHFYLDGAIYVRPYIRTAVREERYDGDRIRLKDGAEAELTFCIPDTGGDSVAEVGFHIEAAPDTVSRVFAMLELKEMTVTGKGEYHIATALCREEVRQQIPFSMNHGAWRTEGGALIGETEEPAQAYTGSYYMTDGTVASDMQAAEGSCLIDSGPPAHGATRPPDFYRRARPAFRFMRPEARRNTPRTVIGSPDGPIILEVRVSGDDRGTDAGRRTCLPGRYGRHGALRHGRTCKGNRRYGGHA